MFANVIPLERSRFGLTIAGDTDEEVEMAESIHWSHDFNLAEDEARRQGKPILLDFSAAPM